MNPLLTKLLAVSGGVAFTMIGVALYRQQRRKNETNKTPKEWQGEKASLQKDKELLEQKLMELETLLERMSKETETLKTSLKDKQKTVLSHEAERERMQEQESKARQETNVTIDQLQRRAQSFLRELEAKSLLCDEQALLILSLEASNKQLSLEKKALMAEMVQKDLLLKQSNEHLVLLQANRDLVVRDVKLLLSNYVFKHSHSHSHVHKDSHSHVHVPVPVPVPLSDVSNLVEHPKVSPLVVGISSVQDPTLASICKKYAQQQYILHEQSTNNVSHENGKPTSFSPSDGHSDSGDNSNIVSFTVSVDGSNASKMVVS